MKPPAESIVTIDYQSEGIPLTARMFKPTVFKEGAAFCCILGEDPQMGIFGCGDTPQEALTDWALAFEKRVNDPEHERVKSKG